mgnify:CR=1 FL=1
MALGIMYHNIVANDEERDAFHPAHRPYVLTRREFAEQLDAALGLGWKFLRIDELYTDTANDDRRILLTFDDSWENRCAVEVMEERGIQGIFFLNSGELGWPGRLTADAVGRMAAAGQEIGSHGAKHEFLTRLSESDLRKSLSESAKILSDITGKPTRFLSAPGGRYNGLVARVAKEVGYEAFFVSWPGFARRIGRDFLMKRISVSVNTDIERFRWILTHPSLHVLRRKAKYAVMRFLARFSTKHGGEGH